MNKINFDAPEMNAPAQQQSERKTVSPGVDIFTIEEAEAKENSNGKAFIGFKFVNKDGKYFKDQFYITTVNAQKRVKELATNSGVSLGQSTPEEIAAKLMGAKVGLVVGGDKEFADIDGKQVAVTRAKIKGAYNFSFKPTELEKWKDSKIEIEDKTVGAVQQDPMSMSSTTSDDSLPF